MSKLKKFVCALNVLAISAVASIASADGLQVVEDTTSNIFDILDTIGTPIVAIAIIVGGFLLIFRRASMEVAGGIIIGGMLIGGAAELAAYITGGSADTASMMITEVVRLVA